MKILWWVNSVHPAIGGIETLSVALLPALARRGFELRVIAAGPPGSAPFVHPVLGVPVHLFPFDEALDGSAPALRQIVEGVTSLKREFRPALVHGHLGDAGLVFHLATEAAHRAPLVLTLHGELPERARPHDDLLRSLVTRARIVTCVSRAIHDDLMRIDATCAPRARVVSNGLTLDGRHRTEVTAARTRFLCLGRLVPHKNFGVAVEALDEVREDFPAAGLTIAGSGPERASLEALCRRYDLAGRVAFPGPIPAEDRFRLIRESLAVLVPSVREGFSMVTLEAGLLERVTIAHATGGLRDLVLHGETGFLLPEVTRSSLARAMARVLSSPEELTAMERRARKHMEQGFTERSCVDRYCEIYEEATAGA